MSTLNLGVASSMGGQLAVDAAPVAADTTADPTAWVAPSWDEIVRLHADRVYRLAYRLSAGDVPQSQGLVNSG